MTPIRSPFAAAVFVLMTMGVWNVGSESAYSEEIEPQGFEYHFRVGKLNLDYKRYGVASDAFARACRLPGGLENFECYRLWATAAERAHRIADALFAWDGAEVVAEQGNTLARDEAARIRSVYGEVVLHAPYGAALPSLPIALEFEGLLLDPELKSYIQVVTSRLSSEGLRKKELFLPGGVYLIRRLDTPDASGDEVLRFSTAPGERVELLLPEAVVPYRGGQGRGAAMAGSRGVGLALEVGGALTPGMESGVVPVVFGVQARWGGRVGPVRIEGRLRAGMVPTRSTTEAEDRAGVAGQVLGQLDLGLEFQPGPGFAVTPHVGFVGGGLPGLLVPCIADRDGVRWSGECRVAAVAIGGQAGVDVSVFPGDHLEEARWEIRFGVRIDVLRAQFVVGPGDPVGNATIHGLPAAGMSWLGPGGDVGVVLRF